MLFSVNDDFIAATCLGLNDADTLEFLSAGYDAMIDEVAAAVERTTGSTHEVQFDGEDIFVELDADEAKEEYGAPGVTMRPAFRQAFAQSTTRAGVAFSRLVNADA